MTALKDQVVWITGASSGIGEALALLAAQRGAKLILSSRREAELQRVKQLCVTPANVAVLPVDLLNFDAAALAAQAQKFFGPIDVLVNNAGISQRSLMLDTQMDTYRRILELDFFATVALTKALAPGMVARKRGHVVVISSVVGYISTPLRTGYAAAKHALHGFFDAARAELWRDQVKFTVVCPGFIRTQVSVNAVKGDGSPHAVMDDSLAKGMDPARCAKKIWDGVARGVEEIHVGKERIAIYLQRWAPWLVSYAIKRAKRT